MKVCSFLILWLMVFPFEVQSKEKARSSHRGFLGAGLAELTEEECLKKGLRKQGVKVISVFPGTPAEKAGLKVDDIILNIDNEPTSSLSWTIRTLQNKKSGALVNLLIQANGKTRKLAVTLASHPRDLLEEVDPSQPYNVRKIMNQSYCNDEDGDSEKHTLNLIIPVSSQTFPVLIWVHGGAWSFGDKDNETALGIRFAERGLGFAAINHRLSSQSWHDSKLSLKGVRHPAHVKDCASALAWIAKNIQIYGGDPSGIFLAGHSSGAHLVTLLALDHRYLKEAGLTKQIIKGVIPAGGAYHLVKYHNRLVKGLGKDKADAHLKTIFGTDETYWIEASPVNYLKGCTIPMLVITEEDSAFQQYKEDFKEAVQKTGVKSIKFWSAVGRTHRNLTVKMAQKCPDRPRDEIIHFIISRRMR
ncbi:carboxylesterase family protein [Candidatus Riflebacteria bacterium]